MGGGVMRTAAKVGAAAAAAAAGGGGRFRHAAPAFATAPASAEAAAPLVSAVGEVPAAAPWASWEVDEWDFADWRSEGAEAEETAAGKPRLVFAPPSLEEAEEATTELRDAIDRVYFSEAPEVVKEQDKELNNHGADAIIPAMPGHVVQAFTFLKSSPEAQSVVASLASDKNVWDAVLKNQKVMEFYQKHQQPMVHTFPEDSATVESPLKFEDTSDESASPFSDFVNNAKKTVMDILHSITHFFQDMFGNLADAHGGESSTAEKLRGPLVALAVAVILVVLFKRA